MSILDSILKIFRRIPEDRPIETPKDTQVNPSAEASVNQVTLSPDMSTLYLIDNNRVIPFNLNNKFGVNISTIDGQITAATGIPVIFPTRDTEVPDLPIPTEDPDTPSDDPAEDGPNGPIHKLVERPRHLKVSTVRRQFTLMFNSDIGVVSIIGASDIDLNIIGASDIDLNIIGASDIDLNVARPITTGEEEPDTAGTETSDPAETSSSDKCLIYSFQIKNKSINIRKVKETLIIRY